MGMSLSTPATSLAGTQPFTPPPPLRTDRTGPEGTAFLWQAPSSDAVVFMGEKWIELHGYVSRVLEKKHALLAKKEMGKQHPAWMEYALQLSRLRGYFTLYPSRETASAVVGVHTDLPDEPEEYEEQAPSKRKGRGVRVDAASEAFDAGGQVDMLKTLPRGGEQQLPIDLPLLSWDGKQKSMESFEEDAAQYTAVFRREVGQCTGERLEKPPEEDRHARDLFCDTDEGKG